MSVQSGEQIDSETLSSMIIGGPPVPNFQPLQVTGCTEADLDLYNQVERGVECAIASEGPGVGPLGQSVLLAQTASQAPISCMIELLTGPYANCDAEIPNEQRRAAYNSFATITGYRPINWNQALNHLNDQQKNILNFNAFYLFFPIFLLAMIVIWLMVGFGWFNWVVGLFLSGLVFIVLYGFSMLYRIHAHTFINDQNQQLQQDVSDAQNNFENSIAYWPQGLFAAACAVTATGGASGWTCNEISNCPACPSIPSETLSGQSRKSTRQAAVCGGSLETQSRVIPKVLRKKRVLRTNDKLFPAKN